MQKQLLIATFSSVFFCMPVVAQIQMQLSGPTSGVYFFKQQKALMPIRGIPGSATFTSPLLAGLDLASVSGDGRRALVSRDGASFLVEDLRGSNPVLTPAASLGTIDSVAWSADSSKALIYSSAGGLSILDGSAFSSLSQMQLKGRPTSLAISDSGTILVGVQGSGIYSAQKGYDLILLSQIDRPAAVILDMKGTRAFVLDSSSNSIQVIQLTTDAPGISLIPLSAADKSDYSGLALSKDGLSLLALDKGSRQVELYNILSGGLEFRISLDFTPTQFQRIAGGDLIAMSETGPNQALYVLDTADRFRISFIPAITNLSAEEL